MKKNTPPFKKISLALLAFATVFMSGCLLTPEPMRIEVAKRVAHPAWMVGRTIPADPFALTAYERIHNRGGIANIYIEGNGDGSDLDFENKPTPKNPVALHLATKDKAENVIYIARPCQYSGMLDKEEECPQSYWNEKIYYPEVFRAFNLALDEIRSRYGIRQFNLIAFDGGAVIAARLAAHRNDVLSLRSVAGKLDHIDDVASLKDVPQHHFIGGQDEVVSPAALHDYMQKVTPTQCAGYTFIQEASHREGWVDKWPELLTKPLSCERKMMESADFDAIGLLPYDPSPYDSPDDSSYEPPEDKGVFTSREMPVKP